MKDIKNTSESEKEKELDYAAAMEKALAEIRKREERERAEGREHATKKKPVKKSERVYSETLTDAAEYTLDFIKQNRSIVKKAMENIDGYERLLREDIALYKEKEGRITQEERENFIGDTRMPYEETYAMLARLMCRTNTVCDMTFLAGNTERETEEFIEKTIAEPLGIRCSVEPRCAMLALPLIPNSEVSDTVVFSGKKMLRTSEANLFGRQIELILGRETAKKKTDLRVFEKLIISYLYVYADGMNPADNDKPGTAKITNAICRCLHTCDSPECCWFSHAALRTDVIPTGTYVTVTPMEEGFPDPVSVVGRWKILLGNRE